MDNRPPFNRFVRSRHAGTSPYRMNFNMQSVYSRNASTQNGFAPRHLELVENTDSTQSLNSQSSASSRSARPRFRELNNRNQNDGVDGKKTGAIPKQPMAVKKSKNNKENRSDDPRLVTGGQARSRNRGRKNIVVYESLPEPPNGPSFHRERLYAESRRLLDLADEWAAIRMSTADLPESVGGEIDSTVGGIKLMVSSKFEQFRGLVDECATLFRVPQTRTNTTQPAKPAVKPEDLDGFWEMMSVQVEALKKRVRDLQTLRENNWEAVQVVKPQLLKPSVSTAAKVTKKPVGKSNFREFLRKKMEAKNENEEVISITITTDSNLYEKKETITIHDTTPSPNKMSEKRVAFATPDLSEFATPLITDKTPMPKTPMSSWKPNADLDPLEQRQDLGFSVEVMACSTPSTTQDTSNIYHVSGTPNGTMFAPYDFSGMNTVLTARTPSRSSNAGFRRESIMTPRAVQNLLSARRSRRSSVDTIIQRAIMAKAVSTVEEQEISQENFFSPCTSPIVEASPQL